jgi:nucleoside-diphosphate-sugar epimerase
VFVAGATGAVGIPLVRQLIEAGWRVYGSTRQADRAEALRGLGSVPVVLDVWNVPALHATLSAIGPDVVVHQLTDLPPVWPPQQMAQALARNARLRRLGTGNLVAATRAAGCRRLVAQSMAWAYAEGPLPHLESDPLDLGATGDRALSVQAVAALESQVLSTPGLDGVVLRYGRLYGPRTWSEQPGPDMPLHVEDAARAAVRAVVCAHVTGVFNVSEPGPLLSIDKAQRLLGWAPRTTATHTEAD